MACSHLWWLGLDQQIEELARKCVYWEACTHNSISSSMGVANQNVDTCSHQFCWPLWEQGVLTCNGCLYTSSGGHDQHILYQHDQRPKMNIHILRKSGTKFISTEFADFLCGNGARYTRSPSFHLESNGAVERSVLFFRKSYAAAFSSHTEPHHIVLQHKPLVPCSLVAVFEHIFSMLKTVVQACS